MHEWQSVALKTLPEMRSEITRAEDPLTLWMEIVLTFDEAYEPPKNDDFIKRVYDYADWCLDRDGGETAADHLPTCVTMFWEHIPTNEAARQDMPRWLSWEQVLANEHFFKYRLTEDELADLERVYAKANPGSTAA